MNPSSSVSSQMAAHLNRLSNLEYYKFYFVLQVFSLYFRLIRFCLSDEYSHYPLAANCCLLWNRGIFGIGILCLCRFLCVGGLFPSSG